MSHVGNLKGAEREMLVSVDLLKRGFEIFRPACATSCDIIALKYGKSLRIEVKGVRASQKRRNPSGPVGSFKNVTGGNADCRLFDVLVRVADDNTLLYQRSIFHKTNAASAELPLRESVSHHTTKKNLERALSMTEKNA